MTMEEYYREQARATWHNDGAIEVDLDARTSQVTANGSWVQAWVWVDQPICAACREPITSFYKVQQTEDGALFHGRCWTLRHRRNHRGT